jgi:response regulator NasT
MPAYRRGARGEIRKEQRFEGSTSAATQPTPLRILVANESRERLQVLSQMLADLGHVPIAATVAVDEVSEVLAAERPAAALVGRGEHSERTLELIARIVQTCPVIASLEAIDAGFVAEAARSGIFGYLATAAPDELQAVIEIGLWRFAEYRNLEQAFGRRAVIERAKGILMVVHGIDDEQAFELLRRHSQQTGHKVVDVAAAVGENQRLLVPPRTP